MCSLPKSRMNVFLKLFIDLNTFENNLEGTKETKWFDKSQSTQNRYFWFLS